MNNIEKKVFKIFLEKNNKIKNNTKINILDVGCYKGQFSLSLYKKFNDEEKKKLKFYLIDANDRYKNFFKENFTFDFKFFKFAIDDKPAGKKKFYINNYYEASGSSLKGGSFKDKNYIKSRTLIQKFINPFTKIGKMVKTRYVPTINLSDFCKKNKIKNIHILKIDTEGTEIDVLKGLKKIKNKISIICIEIQGDENEIERKISFVKNNLKKDFKLVYKKRIYIASFLTNIHSYDFIFSKI